MDFGRDWRGGQHQLLLLARGLAPLGWRSVIVTPAADLAARWRGEGLEAMAPGPARARVRGAAMVHAHDGRALGWALLARLGGGPPLVASRRVAFPLRRAGAWKWRRAARVLAVSGFVRGQLLRAGLRPERVQVVPDAVDLEALPAPAAARREVRAKLGLIPDRCCLACVSALTPEKGVGDLIAALPLLRDLAPMALLTGEGAEQAALLAQAERLGVAAQVVWAAGRCSAAEAVAAADVLVMPSRQEGLGSAILLAWALERTVVAARAGGLPELVVDGQNGLLFPPGDAAALAAALGRVAADAAGRDRYAAAGRASLDERYLPAAMAAATAEVYRGLGNGEG